MQVEDSGEDRLLADLAASPSPYADVVLVLLAAKNEGTGWSRAWARAMRAIQAPRTPNGDAVILLDEQRSLMRELRPSFRAAYEDRERTDAERRRAERAAEKRLADLAELAA